MTRPIVDEYFNKLKGNHYIHGLDSKLEELFNKEKSISKNEKE